MEAPVTIQSPYLNITGSYTYEYILWATSKSIYRPSLYGKMIVGIPVSEL